MTLRSAVVLVVAATLGLATAALLGFPLGGVGFRLYLVTVTAVGLAALVSEVERAVPSAPPSAFDRALRRGSASRPERPAGLVELENLLAGRLSAGDVHFRLRPILREIAAARLRTAKGVDLDVDPEAARRLLGPTAWDLVRPDREPPDDRFAADLDLGTVRLVVEALEALA